MWDSSNFGKEGGFLDTSASFDSPAGKPQGSLRRSQTCAAVNIRQILETGDEGVRLGSFEIHTLMVVAMVRRIEVYSTKVKYTLDDCSGSIIAVLWRDKDNDEPCPIPSIVENTYCRVYGSLRTLQGKKHLVVHKIMELQQLGEVYQHILEVIHTSLKAKMLQASDSSKPSAMDTSNAPNMSNSFMEKSYDNDATGFTPTQMLVYNAILKNKSDIGAHKDEVIRSLAGRMSAKEVTAIVEFLSNEGHIYTTLDEDHYRCTDHS